MARIIVAQREFHPGSRVVVEGPAPEGPYRVDFEDDGAVGYLYAWDRRRASAGFLDALHIYNVQSLTDRERSSHLVLAWSNDCTRAMLLINEYPHALFDFMKKQGHCRSGFPPPLKGCSWSRTGHAWDDEALARFESDVEYT